MRGSMRRRLVAAITAVALVSGMVSLTGVGTAGACEELLVEVPGAAHSYNTAEGCRFVDGIVTNDSTVTLTPAKVKITWAENSHKSIDEWICGGPLAPGQWSAFHLDRPCGVPATWTPIVQGYALPSDPDAKPLAVTIGDVSAPTTDDAGVRSYTVTIKNDNPVAVSSFDVQAIERSVGTTAVVDTLDGCGLPDSLGAGESAQFTLSGSAPWDGALTTDIRITALERPSLALSASTMSPVYGSAVTFSLDLTRADGSAATGCRTLKLFASTDGEEWCDYTCYDTETGSATAVVVPDNPLYFKAIYWGGDDLGFAESDVIYVTPQVVAGAPIVPTKVKARHGFKVWGRISAGARSTANGVTIVVERKRGAAWLKHQWVKATADGTGRYSKTVKLATTGMYRIRAFRAGVGYTPYKSVKVTK